MTLNAESGRRTSALTGHAKVYSPVSPSYISELFIGRSDGKRQSSYGSVLDQRAEVVAVELLASVQELELDDECEADDLSAKLLDEVDLRLRRPARGEKIVVDEDARAARDRVRVQLESVEAVLESVLGAHRPPGQLSRLARSHEPALEPVGERGAEDEAAGLGAQDEVGLPRLGKLGELFDRFLQRLPVGEQRHDVLEDDSPLGEVWDVPDLRLEIDRHARAARANGPPARREAVRAPGRAPRASGGLRGRPGADRGCANGASAPRSARASRPPARLRS